jgi:acyl-CoA synthetase (NDP forming)
MYVESIKDGPRFLETARRVGRTKPIVMLKGGRSELGNRAAASHTGALASNQRVFAAACDQAGIVSVDYSMDMLDLAAAFSALPLPRGNRVAIMTLGGGWGVVASDLCAWKGLELPELTPELLSRLDEILPPYWSRTNPVDIVGEQDWSIPMTIMEALLSWEGCDAVLNLGILGRRVFGQRLMGAAANHDPRLTRKEAEAIVEGIRQNENRFINHIVNLMERYQKPVYGVTLLAEGQDQTVFRIPDKPFAGIFYPTPERAVKAIAKMVAYAHFRRMGSNP